MIRSQKKIILLLFHLVWCVFIRAQVAVNNTNPQGIFHVDGAKDNPATGAPTTSQQANDFVVKADGKVGIGTTTPQTKLDLLTTANSVGLQHTDGTIRLQTFLGRGNTNSNTDAGWLGTSTNHPLDFMTSNTFRVRITPEGNVGIGTATPAVKLEINNGTTAGAIKITDGTQGAGKVLTSDATGVGSWSTQPSLRPVVAGVYPATPTTYTVQVGSQAPATQYTGTYIDLSRGKWIVNACFVIESLRATKWFVRTFLSSSTTSMEKNGFNGSSTYVGDINSEGSGTTAYDIYSSINGSLLIEVTEPTLRIYLLIENRPHDDTPRWRYSSGTTGNYFYALPVN